MDFFHKLLNYYHLDEKGYAEISAIPSFSSLPSIKDFPSVKKAKERILKAKERGEKVLIYGDYDCDGVMAASIMKKALLELGVNTEAYLPSRYLDGYGLNVENTQSIIKKFQLIITVDNGVSAYEAIDLAYQNNVDVIVLDHHSYEVPPEHIVSLIHPNTVGLSTPSISAGFLSYLFASALLERDDPYLEMLGATSLISDSMEITSYNFKAVKLLFSLYEEYGNEAFYKLIGSSLLNEGSLSMQIIPCINSIGRMNTGTKINHLIKYFVNPSCYEASIIADWMKDVNQERKDIVNETISTLEYANDDAGILYESNLPEGINGLLANKILETAKKPVGIYSVSNKDPNLYVGSLRSKEGCPLTDFLALAKPLLVTGGGHSFAAGFSIKKEDLKAFRTLFNDYVKTKPFVKEKEDYIELNVDEITKENYDLLKSFGPFFLGHKTPSFLLKFKAEDIRFSPDGKRLQTYLSKDARLFSFSYPKGSLPTSGEIIFKVKLSENVFRGKTTISADVSDFFI